MADSTRDLPKELFPSGLPWQSSPSLEIRKVNGAGVPWANLTGSAKNASEGGFNAICDLLDAFIASQQHRACLRIGEQLVSGYRARYEVWTRLQAKGDVRAIRALVEHISDGGSFHSHLEPPQLLVNLCWGLLTIGRAHRELGEHSASRDALNEGLRLIMGALGVESVRQRADDTQTDLRVALTLLEKCADPTAALALARRELERAQQQCASRGAEGSCADDQALLVRGLQNMYVCLSAAGRPKAESHPVAVRALEAAAEARRRAANERKSDEHMRAFECAHASAYFNLAGSHQGRWAERGYPTVGLAACSRETRPLREEGLRLAQRVGDWCVVRKLCCDLANQLECPGSDAPLVMYAALAAVAVGLEDHAGAARARRLLHAAMARAAHSQPEDCVICLMPLNIDVPAASVEAQIEVHVECHHMYHRECFLTYLRSTGDARGEGRFKCVVCQRESSRYFRR